MDTHPDVPEAIALELWNRIREAEDKQEPQRSRNIPVRADLLALYSECLKAVHRGGADAPSSSYLN